jgi:RimJ/RimL family protein N-acetyltransferase
MDARVDRSIATFIEDTLAPGGRGESWWWFYLRCPSEEWADVLREILPEERTVENLREFYQCEKVIFDWRGKVPAGFELLRVDEQILARDDLINIERIRRWAGGNFGSYKVFLKRGFAYCIVRENKIVSVCCADNASGRRCEVGVHTDEDYRRRGIATLTVAAAVDWALSNGFEQVGWHCMQSNIASAATARKVGFQKIGDYSAFKVCARPADAYIQKGNMCLLREEFADAAQWYRMALRAVTAVDESASYLLSRREDRARYAFQAACALALADDREAGLESLSAAIEMTGYRQAGY